MKVSLFIHEDSIDRVFIIAQQIIYESKRSPTKVERCKVAWRDGLLGFFQRRGRLFHRCSFSCNVSGAVENFYSEGIEIIVKSCGHPEMHELVNLFKVRMENANCLISQSISKLKASE